MAIDITFWSGMHHQKYEGGGGGGEFLERYVIIFSKPAGVQDCFSNLENLFFCFLCNAGFLFLKFWFCKIFSRFLDPPPPPPLRISNGASLMSCYLQCIPESVGMRSHIMGVVKPIAQGWGYSKATLSSQSL